MAFLLLLVGTKTSFAQHAQLELGKIEANWWSSMWSKEVVNDAPAFIRIKNRWKSTNLHNEYKVLLVGETDNNWTSAMWVLEPVSGASGYFRIKNRRTGTYIHNESGKVELGQIQPNWWSAMWLWEPVNGAPGFFRIQNRNTGTYLHNQNQKMSIDVEVEVASEGGQFAPAKRGEKVGCPDGQINDPIDGGTCWTCPEGYKRTVFHIKSDKACERAASEIFAPAKSHGRATGLLGTDCAGGQFWDPNGNCYSCPPGYNRTAYSVTSAQACSQRVHADFKPAKKEEKSAVKCGPGSFLDISTQTCWTCPDGYVRTVYPVNGEKACERKQ